jgi:hypothetical protein
MMMIHQTYFKTTLDSISHKLGLRTILNWNLFSPFPNMSHRKVFFFIPQYYAQHHIHEQIFNTLFTNLHLVYLHYNWILVQLLNWIEVEFNSIQVACNIIQYFGLNGT